MALLRLTRWRLFAFLACAILPTFFLFQLDASSLYEGSLSFLPSKSRTKVGSSSSGGGTVDESLVDILDQDISKFDPPAHPPSVHDPPHPPPPPEPTPEPITNNNATYPRLSVKGTHTAYAEQARKQLERVEASRHLLSGFNEQVLKNLISYLRRAESDESYVPPKVVLTSWHWIPCALGQCTTGEVQWVRPLIDIMKAHDIMYLFSPWERFHEDWRLLGGDDLVTHAWVDDEHVVYCFYEPDKCLKTDKNPEGIPPWMLFAFTFWGSKPNSERWHSKSDPYSFNPLGSEWNLVPYQMPEKQFYLGYHYQGCQALKYIPFSERENRIVVLAKLESYFYNSAFDPKSFYSALHNHTTYDIVTNAGHEDGKPMPIPEGLRSMGILPQDEYDHLLANAKALLGIGRPLISPTPYASLCRGVPVILPYDGQTILKHNQKTCGPRPGPDEWCGFLEESHQHGPASAIGPPYVYAVDLHSPIEEILKVVDTALNTPIEPYEPPDMRKEAVEKRLLDYFEIDWKRYADDRIKERGSDKLVLPDFLQAWAKARPDPIRKDKEKEGRAEVHRRHEISRTSRHH